MPPSDSGNGDDTTESEVCSESEESSEENFLNQRLPYYLLLIPVFLSIAYIFRRSAENNNIFDGISTKEDLKAKWKEFLLKHHPDKNGHLDPDSKQKNKDFFVQQKQIYENLLSKFS